MKKEKSITIVQYDNCAECPYCEFPDKQGEINCPGNMKIIIRKEVINKFGTKISNPIKARCGINGRMLIHLSGCKRWFNNNKIVNIN